MGDSLTQEFLDKEITDLNIALLRYGVQGILDNFEMWLREKELLKED